MADKDKNSTDEARAESPHSVISGSQDGDKKNKFPGVNLYVKNLDDSFTDDFLREAFDEFGTITSAKVMCDASGHSKGFGFVCFTTQKEANNALTKMNGRIVGTKPLYVAMAQKKEERKQYLSDKYKNFNMNSSVPFTSPPPVPQTPTIVPQPVESPSHIQYIPNNTVVQQPVQYRFFPGNFQWPTTGPSPYVMPQPGTVNHTVAYTPYQPLYVVPGINMMAPPQQMPILHRPIYIHSSKTNTLIYSTGVQAAPPQVSSPGSYVTTPSGSEGGGMVVQPVQHDGESPQPNTNFKDIASNATPHNQHPATYSSVDTSQLQNAGSAVYGQTAYSANYNISLNNGFTT